MDDGILRFPKVRSLPVGRLAAAPRSGTDGGYPWVDGELLYAADLNAAIAGATNADAANVVSVLNHGAKGDGTTDDTAAIQAVLNAYAGTATVLIPRTGSNYIVGPLNPPSYTDLLIEGTLLLKAASPGGGNTGLIYINGQSYINVRGHGILDGNSANAQTPVLNIVGSNNISVSGVTCQNAYYWNLAVQGGSYNCWIDKVSMIGGHSANGFSTGSYNCWATGCYINGPAGDEGFSFYGGVYNCGAIGNVVTNAGDSGINVLNDAAQPAPSRDLIISNNIISGCLYGGIGVGSGSGGAGSHWAITIANNRLYNNNVSNASWCPQIAIDHCGSVTIGGNVISDDDTNTIAASHACTHGIYVDGTAASVTITGNSVFNIGSSTRPGVGLFVNAGPNGVNASGNMFADFRPTAYMTTAIGGAAGANNAYTNNVIDVTGGVVSFSGIQSDTVIFNSGAGHGLSFGQALPPNAANDAAAATAGVPVGGLYRAGSALMVRVT